MTTTFDTLTPEQCRRARELLGWSMLDLAEAAGVRMVPIIRLEDGKKLASGAREAKIRRALEAAGIEFTDDAVALIAEEGFDPEFGARPLRRAIQRRVDNTLSRMVLEGSLERGDKLVVVGAGEGKLGFEIIRGATGEEGKEG